MTGIGIVKLIVYFAVLTGLAVPLGALMARAAGNEGVLARVFGPLERLFYRLAGVREEEEMDWRQYAKSVMVFSLFSVLAVYLLERLQGSLPLNPLKLGAVEPGLAFNTAVSFTTNTNWQAYGGETTMSFLTQMAGLTVQNFVSAAVGIAVLYAVARGFARKNTDGLGNFWVDLTRVTLRVLLPLSFVLALVLCARGMPQTFTGAAQARPLEAPTAVDGGPPATERAPADQRLALGPVASQVAIKQLGTNGGGFFNVNSSHPYENPTPFTNFLECLAILLIPGACVFAFGRMIRDRRQAIALYATMMVLLVPLVVLCVAAEQRGNPLLSTAGVDQHASALQAGGNMEGKEVRFGITESALWCANTTAASNGSVNSMHDSYTPLGGLVPLVLMQLGEVVFGGVGCGLYGMLLYAIIAVFIAGLMVGRTPEYLGKKLESYEMKWAAVGVLVPALFILVGTAVALEVPGAVGGMANPAAHGYSEILYAFSSASGNNGSAFAGLSASGPFLALTQAVAMWICRFLPVVAVLAVAGSLAAKRSIPESTATLPTHRTLFVVLLAGTVILIGLLTFVPALALGPLAEHFMLFGGTP